MSNLSPKIQVDPSYVSALIARALKTARSHADAATRARAEEKARRLERTLGAMLDGSVAAGSRAPVSDTPTWATLEVVKGGFATGGLLAGGPLQPHEEALLGRVASPTGREARALLNAWHLGGEGLAALGAMLAGGRYRVEVPEEAALMVAAWLLAHGADDRAHELLGALVEWFDRLRFYPVPGERPLASSALVRLQPVRDTVRVLNAVTPRAQIARMNETLRVWTPLEDRLVALLLETVEGESPRVLVNLVEGVGPVIVRTVRGTPAIVGGAPFERFPEGWTARANALIADFDALRRAHALCKRSSHKKSNLARLVEWVRSALRSPRALTPRDRGSARAVLAAIAHKRGVPGAASHQRVRSAQASMAALPTRDKLARVVSLRLAALPQDGGLADLDGVMTAVRPEEAARVGTVVGAAIPTSLEHKLRRSLEAPIEDLVALGVITSGEVLAIVAPQITSQVRAAGIADADLRRLYEATYMAFRKRRSLLLLDLQSQVRIEELPWVAAIDRERREGVGAEVASRQTLERLAGLTLRSFPDVIIPNKMVTELQGLADAAKLKLPLVEEIAADIFMGTFSLKFVRAARLAAGLLRGTLYERYYALPYEQVLALSVEEPPKGKSRWATSAAPSSEDFASLCRRLARAEGTPMGSSVARNGTIIEQAQLLTTHNLAALYQGLDLRESVGADASELARRCFASICRQHEQVIKKGHAQLLRCKSTAYAWRQMMFFLSVAPPGTLDAFLPWASEALGSSTCAARLAPALRGLRLVASGGTFDADGYRDHGGPARRMLGWTTSKHWLMT